MKTDLYKNATDRILSELAKGVAPWVKPWRATAGRNMPCNADTNRPYSGANIIFIWMAMQSNPAWITPRFLTFKQCLALGGRVIESENKNYIRIYFVKPLLFKDKNKPANPDGTDPVRKVTMLREFCVYNVAQCTGLPDRCYGAVEPKPRNPGERDSLIDSFVGTIGADLRHGGDRAFYASGETRDWIQLPEFRDFKSPDHYYATSFHEHGHWTGAKSRLDREFGKRFGDSAYAAEELVAELCSAFLCAEFGIDGELQQASYIAKWIELLKHDNKAFFTAASKAQAAADYLRQFALADTAKEVQAA